MIALKMFCFADTNTGLVILISLTAVVALMSAILSVIICCVVFVKWRTHTHRTAMEACNNLHELNETVPTSDGNLEAKPNSITGSTEVKDYTIKLVVYI